MRRTREGVGPLFFLAVRKRDPRHLLSLREGCIAGCHASTFDASVPFLTVGIPCRLFYALSGALPPNPDWDRFRGEW